MWPYQIIETPGELSDPVVMISEPFDISIEEMPIIFADNFDCQEITVKADDEGQKNQNKSKQDHDKGKEYLQINFMQKPGIKIISDIKCKLPLPLKKKNNNSIVNSTERSNLIRL